MSHLTKQDIERQLTQASKEFYEKPFQEGLPEKFNQYFRNALFGAAPMLHQIHVTKLRDMMNRRNDELSILQVGLMINLILAIPLKQQFDNLDEALDVISELETVKTKYNEMTQAFAKSLQLRQRTLEKLAGLTSAAPFNAMQVVGQA